MRAPADQLIDARVGEAASLGQPQPLAGGVWVAGALAQVAVEGLHGLDADAHDADAAAFR
jgi:hypothetical protein